MSEPVTLSDLQKMHRMAVALVNADPVYSPIFERIEHELAVFEDTVLGLGSNHGRCELKSEV